MCTYTCTYIYIYIERERERYIYTYIHIQYICIYIYISLYISIHIHTYTHNISPSLSLYIYIYMVYVNYDIVGVNVLRKVYAICVCAVWTRINLFGPGGMPCVVLWRPEALDCRVLLPSETLTWLTRNPPSLRFKPRTSCI